MAEAEEEMEHPRLIMHNFLSLEECKELEFIHKSCCTTGYRPNVFSTTLSHLIFTNSAHLIIPFVPIRERLKDKAEEFFHCEYELFIEFTGLISWTQGASIGWHSDDNRAYLKQRDFAAVCYLNNYGEDFKGGLFHFQDGDPTTVMPMAGDVLMYTADDRNIHSVDEITDGERLTLTLWFSRDNSHDEDAKLISILSHSVGNKPDSCIPLPGSTCMYWFPPGQATQYQSGFDIRWARLLALGFDLYSSHESSSVLSSADRMSELSMDPRSSDRISELLMEPLQVARENELFEQEFANIMHVLQVVQFYYWKASEMQTPNVIRKTCNKVVQLSKSQTKKINSLSSIFLKDHKMAETVFNRVTCGKSGALLFNWADISAAVAAWDEYTCKLCKDIVTNLPYWRTQQSIFSVPFSEC